MVAGGRLRLVQVGAGAMGRLWLRTIRASPDVELVGLVDVNVDTARRAAAEAGLPELEVAGSLEALLAGVAADAVLNVTVPAAHRGVSTTALLAGLPVLCEKPLAESVAAGLSMVAAAELSGRLLMVSQSRRYWRTLDALRGQVGAIQPLGQVDCRFFRAPHFGGFRDAMPYPLLIDMAIHQFDLARDLIGRTPVAVYCDSFNPPWSWYAGAANAVAAFEFADGCRFTFAGSWCSPGLETSWNGCWRVSGAGGTATWDGDHGPAAEDGDGRPIPGVLGNGPEQIDGSLAEFVAAVRSGGSAWGEARDNILSLAMVEAAVRSAEARRRVEIAEVLEDAYAEAVRSEPRADLRRVLRAWRSARNAVGHSGAGVPDAAGRRRSSMRRTSSRAG
jgi:predicted dehydrogenase